MLGLLIVAFGALATAGAWLLGRTHGGGGRGWREAAVWGMVLTALWAAAGAEALGVVRGLRFGPVLVWWGLPCILMAGALWRGRGSVRASLPAGAAPDRIAALLWGITGLVLLATFLGAALTLPNTWDAWTYHLPRQVHWVQNGSVAHFAATNRRQLEMPPLAEYIGVHWMILSGSGGWANMVQWFALAGCALASACAAGEMGAGPRGRALAALLAVTIPAAAMQAMNAKNDVVVAFLALALMLAGLRFRAGRTGWGGIGLAGATLGLLLLTKGTGYLIALPVSAAMGVELLRRLPARRALGAGAAIACIALALNTPHWGRNLRSFGHPLSLPASRGGYDLANTSHSPAAFASNLVRNLALHTVVPDEGLNRHEQHAVEGMLDAIGAEPSDPATTYAPERFPFALRWTGRLDGQAPAPGHLVLAVALMAIAAFRPRWVREGPGWAWFLVPFVAFALFCLYLKWQVWHQRLHIPFLALLCPAGGALLARRGFWAAALPVSLLSVGVSVCALLLGETRRLLPPRSIFQETRTQSLYHNAPYLLEPMERLGALLHEAAPRAVGLDLISSNYEYPLLRAIRTNTRARIVNIGPRTGATPDPGALDMVISSSPQEAAPTAPETGAYGPVLSVGPFTVKLPADRVAAWLAEHRFSGWGRREGLDASDGGWSMVREPARLWFDWHGGPAMLVIEARVDDPAGARQSLLVHLNGNLVAGIPVQGSGVSNSLALEPRPGRNFVTLSRPRAADTLRFTRLQVRPGGEIPADPAGAPAQPH